jgi:transposase
MKTYNLQKVPSKDGVIVAAEIYAAPPPPDKGRVIGLDCHPETFTAAVFKGQTPHDARKVGSRLDLSLEELLKWVAVEFTREDLFLMEAGSNSFEICRRLLSMGMRAVVLESCHVGKHAKTYADNDKMAAARIALVFLAGNAPCVWIPDSQTCERRELLHAHLNAVASSTSASNTLKSYLSQFGIRLGSRGLQKESTRHWIYQQREWSDLQKELLADYFAHLDIQAERRQQFKLMIHRQVIAEPLMLRCMKLLGIGVINAFALLAIIGDVKRFERPEKLVAYVGLNPGQRSSGRCKNIKLGVGKRGRGDIRALLTQGAQAVLRSGAHTALGKWGWRLFARKGTRNTAVAAVARKLVVQVWHLLSGNPPTAIEQDKSLTCKLTRVAAALGAKLRKQLGFPSTLAACVTELQRRILELQPS